MLLTIWPTGMICKLKEGRCMDANRCQSSRPFDLGIECSSGETLTAGSLEIFGDVWKYSKLRCNNLSYQLATRNWQVEHWLNTGRLPKKIIVVKSWCQAWRRGK